MSTGYQDAQVAELMARFGANVRENVKGLSDKVICRLFGSESSYLLGGNEGQTWDGTARDEGKGAEDWECYVFSQSAGSSQGRATGRVLTSGRSASFEEKKDAMFVHQLLPEEFSVIQSRCAFPVPALAERARLLAAEPVRASAALFFHTYQRCVYRSVSASDEALLLELLTAMPGEMAPSELVEQIRINEEKFKSERKSVVPEIEAGKIRIYYKEGKKKILVNGWIFGEESGGGAEEDAPSAPAGSVYDGAIAGAGFHARMVSLLAEAALLLGENSSELIELVADHKEGRFAKMLATIDKFTELVEANMLPPAQVSAARGLLERFEHYAKPVSKYAHLAENAGIDLDALKLQQQNAVRLRRKLLMLE